jgi:sec-independent protein translocase protein TatC
VATPEAAGGPPVEELEEAEQAQLTFTEHLEELRKRLIVCLLALGIGAAAAFAFAQPVYHFLMTPILDALPEGARRLVFTSAVEGFLVYLRVAVYAGLFLAAPVILHQFWRFVAPGLYAKEKRVVLPFVFFGTVMFVGGAAFCYYVVMPIGMPFLIGYAEAEFTEAMLSMREQLTLVKMLLLAFGLVFELPLIIAALAMIGLVDAPLLSRYRRYAIVIAAIVSAILTPQDPFSMILMAVPMYLFYELGILLAWIIGKRRGKREAAEDAADAASG